MDILTIVSWVLISISLVLGGLTAIIPNIKNTKAKKFAEKTVKAISSFELIVEAIQPLVIKAEKFLNYSGQEKKEWVMTNLRNYAFQNQIVFNEKLISDKVEEIVATTNHVNVEKKSKPKSQEFENFPTNVQC